jgi:methylated-DNA-[protein]-cysteine S-methyltransferase
LTSAIDADARRRLDPGLALLARPQPLGLVELGVGCRAGRGPAGATRRLRLGGLERTRPDLVAGLLDRPDELGASDGLGQVADRGDLGREVDVRLDDAVGLAKEALDPIAARRAGHPHDREGDLEGLDGRARRRRGEGGLGDAGSHTPPEYSTGLSRGRPTGFAANVACGYTPAMPRHAGNPADPPADAVSPGERGPAVVAVLATPVGPLHAAATDEGIVGLELRTTDEAFASSVRRRTRRPVLAAADPAAPPAARANLAALEREVAEHLAWARDAFDLPVVLEGISDWDRTVLEGVRAIPRGSTASYGEIARRIGRPGAARAVGGAVGRNPIGLLIPCHRVIAGDGTLGGYGGSWFGSREELLGLKERLLELEGVAPPPRSAAPGGRTR